jgi:hypothetical protein
MSNNFNTKNNKGVFNIVLTCIIILLIVFFVYSTIKSYYNYTKTSPYLIDGILDGSVSRKFNANNILPSSDTSYGTEFTYSCWLFIKDTNFVTSSVSASSQCADDSPNALKHIFHKGSYDYVPNGGTSTNKVYYPLLQMPGVWLYPNTNKLNIQFNTYENVIETADVGNIPLNMWVNLVIILIGGSVDIYINGNLKKRNKLKGVPKINYGDFYVTNWGGFQGYTSRLRYFNYAIQPFLVDQIFNLGPGSLFAQSNKTNGIMDASAQLAPNYWMTTGFPNSAGYPGYKQNSQTTA